MPQIRISSSKSSLVAGESVNLTCSATLISENSSTSGIQYVWSGPAMNDSGSSQILSLHNIHLSQAGEYKCSASLHNSSITAGISVVNPRRACAARVTVVGLSVCLSVCLSVR